jgi:hypothetical protein
VAVGVKIALDTNRYSDLDKGLPEVVEAVGNADEVFRNRAANPISRPLN